METVEVADRADSGGALGGGEDRPRVFGGAEGYSDNEGGGGGGNCDTACRGAVAFSALGA